MELQYYKVEKWRKEPFTCPHNKACVCTVKTCNRCGWHPSVEKYRMAKLLKERGL